MSLRPSAMRLRLRLALSLALALAAGTGWLFSMDSPATGGFQLSAPTSISPNCETVPGELPNLCPSTPTNASDGTHHPELHVLPDGTRRYHFDSVIWNAGGAFELEGSNCDDDGCSTIRQRIWEDDGTPGGPSRFEDVPAGRMIVEVGDGHDHYHYENATFYELIRPGASSVPVAKIGFCMLDTFENRNGVVPTSYYPQGSGTCGAVGDAVPMGISRGWGDYYSLTLANQWIVVTDIPAGEYTLRSTVNPGNEFIESNYDDNVLEETRQVPGATAGAVAASTEEDGRVTVELSGTVEGRFVDVVYENGPFHNSAGPTLDFELVDRPQNGNLGSIERTGATTAEITYTPNRGFAGTDTFTYRTSDDRDLDSLPATVTVTVGAGSSPPTAPPAPPAATAPGESGAPRVDELPRTTSKPARRQVVGTSLADVLEGTRLNELFRGLAGPDEITGSGGNDRAYGGRGRDTMKLGNGRDAGYGGKGKDKVMLGNGADVGYGGRGSDLLVGGNGRDALHGGKGGDTLMIRDGKPDTADCGPGLDTVIADLRDVIDENCEIVELPPGADDGSAEGEKPAADADESSDADE